MLNSGGTVTWVDDAKRMEVAFSLSLCVEPIDTVLFCRFRSRILHRDTRQKSATINCIALLTGSQDLAIAICR